MRSGVLLTSLFAVNLASADVTTDVAAIRNAATTCEAARTYCFAIHLHIAEAPVAPPGTPELVVTPAWIATQVATANQHFARLDVGFQIAQVETLPSTTAHLHTRAERSALGKLLSKRVIDVFITGQLDDVDQEGAVAFGVTWRNGNRKFIIVSGQAMERTLAHELGHFFGLPHSTYPISIMNKTKRDTPPLAERTFHDEEYAKMGPVLRGLVKSNVVANVAARKRR